MPCVSDTGATAPISALTSAFSIGSGRGLQTDEFEPRIIDSHPPRQGLGGRLRPTTGPHACHIRTAWTRTVPKAFRMRTASGPGGAQADQIRPESDPKATRNRRKAGPKAGPIRTTCGRPSSQAVPSTKFHLKSSRASSWAAPRLVALPKAFDRMDLTPKLPPGRANRKALAFAAEIHRLRAAGYSFEAIRLTLLEAGVEVSRTTVKREAAKRPAVSPSSRQRHAPQLRPPLAGSTLAVPAGFQEPAGTSPVLGSFVGDSRSGKEIVDAFMQGRITNPLMQERTRNEGRSD